MAGLLTTSTMGDRIDIRNMLRALSPVERLLFLCDCCRYLGRPDVFASSRDMPLREARRCDVADDIVTKQVYLQLAFLKSEYGLDLEAAVTRLAGYASRPAALRENPSLKAPLARALAVGRASSRRP